MPSQDTSQIKEKILSILRIRGPSIPVQIARQINLNTLLTSAFLSELLSEKKIKTSNMKVGGTPIYLMSGQENLLERFSQYLKSREKDAFILLKENKCLKNSEQEPAIRVALRAIKDFAMPFKYKEEIYWRYLTTSKSDIELILQPEPVQIITREKITKEIPENSIGEISENKELNISDKTSDKRVKLKKKIKKVKNIQDDKFFTRIKSFLSEKSMEIINIEFVNKDNLAFRVRENNKDRLIIAHNKKRITEQDILKASKKAQEINLPYEILSFGEPPKKISKIIGALKNMHNIRKID